MPEPTIIQAPTVIPKFGQPKVVAPVAPSPEPIKEPTVEDIVKRVAVAPAPEPEIKYNSGDIEKIQDPQAKAIVQDLYKQYEKGFNKRFMEVADKEKTLQVQKDELMRQQESMKNWTPERINQLLNDPNFVNAATQVANSKAPQNWEGTQEQWNSVPPEVQNRIKDLEGKMSNVLSLQNQNNIAQADDKIRSKFSDYNPTEVDSLLQQISEGKMSTGQIRELAWIAKNFDRYVQDAYKFGREDRNGNITEKINATPLAGTNAPTTPTPTQPVQGETGRQLWNRIVQKAKLDLGKK